MHDSFMLRFICDYSRSCLNDLSLSCFKYACFYKLILVCGTFGCNFDDLKICIHGSRWLGAESFLWRHYDGHAWTWRCDPFLCCFSLVLCIVLTDLEFMQFIHIVWFMFICMFWVDLDYYDVMCVCIMWCFILELCVLAFGL